MLRTRAFAGDVLEHQHIADRLTLGVEKRRRRQVDRCDAAVRLRQIGVGVVVGGTHLFDEFEAAGDPRVEIAKCLPGWAVDELLRRQPENALCRLVDLDDHALPIERDDTVRERPPDALVVVLQRQHVGKQARIFERHRDARSKGFQPADVDMGEPAASLVEHLDDAETLAGPIDDRQAEEIAGAKPGKPVDFLIEAWVGIGVGYVEDLAAGKRRARDPGIGRYADLLLLAAFGDLRPQLVGARVVDE